MRDSVAAILIVGLLVTPAHAARRTIDDAEEEKEARADVIPYVSTLPDGATIRASFERAFRFEPAGAAELLALTSHQDEVVAMWAARLVGRYQTQEVVTTLTTAYRSDTRLAVRSGALAGLFRSGDPSVASLAIEALADSDGEVQLLGLVALEALGDPSQAAGILSFLDSPTRKAPADIVFTTLRAMGDSPGSTLVRDRLALEANNKANDWTARLEAARVLEEMGAGHLAQMVLDRSYADETYERLLVVGGEIRRAVATRGRLLESQLDLEAVASPSLTGLCRVDVWGREIRVRFLAGGLFEVVSDGPDKTPSTGDDLSTAEAFSEYDARMFGVLFR